MTTLKRIGVLTAFLLLISGIALATDPTIEIRECATVERPTVNLRSGPDTNTDVVGKVTAGEKYPVVTKTNNWIKIHHPQLGEGWLYLPLVALRAETTTVAAPVVNEEPAMTPTASDHPVVSKSLAMTVALVFLGLLMVLAIYSASRQAQQRTLHHHA